MVAKRLLIVVGAIGAGVCAAALPLASTIGASVALMDTFIGPKR